MSDTYIAKASNVSAVFYAVKGIYEDLVSSPVVDPFGQITRNDESAKSVLEVANVLLGALEKLYDLKVGREGSSPRSCGFDTSEMLRDYAQVKHWQKMLNTVYGPMVKSMEESA